MKDGHSFAGFMWEKRILRSLAEWSCSLINDGGL